MCDGISLDEMMILARKILREYLKLFNYSFTYFKNLFLFTGSNLQVPKYET